MIRRLFLFAFLWIVVVSLASLWRTYSASEEPSAQDHIAWVSRAMEKMQTVRPGMMRLDLLKIFRTEGGLSAGLRRTFVSRDCPYFKVDVEFKRAPGPDFDTPRLLTSVEDNRDIIVTVSRPYLQFSIGD